jgi:hypothetical protein
MLLSLPGDGGLGMEEALGMVIYWYIHGRFMGYFNDLAGFSES